MPIYMEISPLHRLVDLFKSLHEARAWVARIQHAPKPVPAIAGAVAQAAADAWADPERQGTVIRGARTRELTTRELVH